MPADTAGTGAWIGKTISHRYQIDSLLGAGGMGFVYRAIDTNLDTHVVLKVPKRILLENPVFTERFVREIRALVSLSHPHVVKILDVGKHEDVPFAVMQYLPGGDLNDRRQGNGKSYVPMPVRIAMGDWLRQVAGAIDFVHDRGFVHRDIKPGNILFDTYGNAYLGDFGVAKVVTETQSNNDLDALTGEGLVLGTMDYMAPEQIRAVDSVGPSADVYALGCTLYFALTGEVPFPGGTRQEKMQRQLNEQPRPIRQLEPGVSEDLCRVVDELMRKDPQERPSSTQAVIARLRPWVPRSPQAMPRLKQGRLARLQGGTELGAGRPSPPPFPSGSSVGQDLSTAEPLSTRGLFSEAEETDQASEQRADSQSASSLSAPAAAGRRWVETLVRSVVVAAVAAALLAVVIGTVFGWSRQEGGGAELPIVVGLAAFGLMLVVQLILAAGKAAGRDER